MTLDRTAPTIGDVDIERTALRSPRRHGADRRGLPPVRPAPRLRPGRYRIVAVPRNAAANRGKAKRA